MLGISTVTLIDNHVILAAGVSALGCGGVIAVVSSLISPAHFDFDETRKIGTEPFPKEVSASSIKDTGSLTSADEKADKDNTHVQISHQALENAGASPFETSAEHQEEIRKLKASWNTVLGCTAAFLLAVCTLCLSIRLFLVVDLES